MIVLDTQVLLFDVLEPRRLTRRAREALAQGTEADTLCCSDISLWEMGMLIAKGRVDARGEAASFIEATLQARSVRVLPITPEIATLAQSAEFSHGDPADRIIAATALAHGAPLLSADTRLRKLGSLKVIW